MTSLDANEILPGLWFGSFPTVGNLREGGFTALAVVAEERAYPDLSIRFPGLTIIVAKLRDEPLTTDAVQTAIGTARNVHRLWKDGGTVLIVCQAGVNRSALVTAMILHLARGVSGAEAVHAIRRARPGALTNSSFLEYLLRLPRRDP